MGIGSAMCYTDTIENELVNKVCSAEYQQFMKMLDKYGLSLEDFARDQQNEDIDNYESDLIMAWRNLTNAFYYITSMPLNLICSNDGEGGRYDDFTGAKFTVDNVWMKTDEAKIFEAKFGRTEKTQWTTFG